MQQRNRSIAALAIPAAIAALAAVVVLLHAPSTQAAAFNRAVVATAKTTLGRILVDSHGRTLYLFEGDHNGKSACTGQCAAFWPPLTTSAKPAVAGGAKASLIGTVKRADGRLQVTYNRHPLYRFVKDTKARQTNGEGLKVFGANWWVVSPNGNKITGNPSARGGSYGH